MIFQLQDLNRSTAHLLPECCRGCGWWQGCDEGWPKPASAEDWRRTAEEIFGRWGKLALGDGSLLGWVQFGPAGLFSRSRELACGPVDGDAILLACSLAAGPAQEPVRKSLVLAVIAELEQQRVGAIEAFCSKIPGENGDCRLMEQEFLKSCGFYPVRSSRSLRLMRLELAGAQPVAVMRRKSRLGILKRLKNPAPTPTPAALCKAAARRRDRVAALL